MSVKSKTKEHKSFGAMVDEVLFCLYCVGYLVLTLLPAVKYSVSYIIAGSYCLVPVAMYFFKFPEYRDRIVFVLAAGAVCGLFTYLTENGAITDIINIPIDYLRYLLPCILFIHTFKVSPVSRWIIWSLAAVVIVYVAIKTSNAIDDDPMIARVLAFGSQEKQYTAYRMQNIGGFGFCYAVGLLFPLFVSVASGNRNIMLRIAAVAGAVVIFMFVLKVQYMILLILCILTIMLAIVYSPKNNYVKFFGCIAVILAVLFLPRILNGLGTLNLGAIISRRLNNTSKFLSGTASIDEATSRIGLYKAALAEFIKSPLWGQVRSVSAAESHSTLFGIGCTSGIIGISTYVYLLIANFKTIDAGLKEKKLKNTAFVISFVAFVVLAALNPVRYNYEISTAVFFLIPLTLSLFGIIKEEKADEKLGT